MSAMSTVAIILLAVPACIASNAGDASVLVQSSSVLVQSPGTAADAEAALVGSESKEVDVSSLVSKPEAVFDMMGKQVGTLEEEMKRVHQENQDAIAKQAATFEAKLNQQLQQNAEIRVANEELANEISKLTASNRQLWQRGKDLQKEAEHQREVVKGIQAKIADASEFAAVQMDELADVDHPDEKVLHELDALDSSYQQDSTHKQNMEMIAELGKAKPPLGLLSVGDSKSDPASILKAMQDGLAHMGAEQRASENQLKAMYAEKFGAAASDHKKLMDEQGSLTAKKAVLVEMSTRLAGAVKHLEDVRDGLTKTIVSLGAFSQKVGKDSLDAQTAGEKKVALADFTEHSTKANEGQKKGGWLSRTFR